MRGGPNAVK